jgi:hypothetical protein
VLRQVTIKTSYTLHLQSTVATVPQYTVLWRLGRFCSTKTIKIKVKVTL